MALFQDCSVLFELKGVPFKEKNKIKLAVKHNGGKISFVANKECSLIVTSDVSSLSPGRLRNIVKHQIPVVGLNYVTRCVEADCRLPVEDFKLDISSANEQPALLKSAKDKWSGSKGNTMPSKVQIKPQQAVSVIQSTESPKGRGGVLDKYRVYNETDRGLPKFPDKFQVAKYGVFAKDNGGTWAVLELQSAKSEKGRKYRVVRYWQKDAPSKKSSVRDKMVFVSTSEEAVKVFQALVDAVRAEGLEQQPLGLPQAFEIGSAPLHELVLEEQLNTGELSSEVGTFVELLWAEALGCIDLILNSPVHKISLNDVTRAEGILLQVQRKMAENKSNICAELLSEYCTLLPQRTPVGLDMSSISKQFDLCQLIRDILNVTEMYVPSTVGKYRALKCSIETVPKGDSEFEAVTSLLRHSKVQVHEILRVNRAPELQSFKKDLGSIKTLLHSSKPQHFVGILSRGLLMPGVAVSQHGIQRTDAGDLGSGIYFSDDINTTLKYSQCSLSDGSRLILVCEVALGRCKELRKKDQTLTRAPEGHDSVHGVRNAPGRQSEFTDDEYVVYSPDQVKLKYVVRLSSEGEELKNFVPMIVQLEDQSSRANQGEGEVEDGIGDIKNPLENVTAGLLNNSGQQIPLQAVHVKCKLVDLLAQVIIFQKYSNESSTPIEAKYVFPLDDSAAVCGFEAFINGKHVVGQVKEKETARREYKQAVEKGHGAYLMDQDAPDVFTISVGNLPPGATVLIKVTFVSELIVKDGSIVFSLPSSVAPWQESAALNQTTQVTVKKVCVTDEEASARQFNLDMSVEMPHKITAVKCVTHQIKMKKTDCKAVVSVCPGEVMGPEGFQLLVTLTEVHVPRMWVENHPDKESQACMLVFYPKFDATSAGSADEVVLLIDASRSMRGESFSTARTIALQILKTLEHNVPVNVIFFGTDHKDAFLSAKPINEARQEAKNFIKGFSAGGSTELWRPLRALSLLPPSSGTRNVLLLSDGHIQNSEMTLQLLRDNATHTRLFTCGLSATANRHMLRSLAQAGGGAYEFFDSKSKHTWSEKVAAQVKRMQAPGASSVSVKWQQFNPTAPPPVQAPKQLHALFNNCHTLVFGFVPHCTKATLLGNLSGQEIETMVSTSELQKTKGTFLHKLTARAIIRDFEDGSLDSNAVLHEEKKSELKSFVIELSKEFSILSQFTSFVAIEERDSEEERGFTDIPKLIAEEDVDFLPYMSWASEDARSDKSSDSRSSSEESDEESDEEYESELFGASRGAKSLKVPGSLAIKRTAETRRLCIMKAESEETSDEDMGFGLFDDDTVIEKKRDEVLSISSPVDLCSEAVCLDSWDDDTGTLESMDMECVGVPMFDEGTVILSKSGDASREPEEQMDMEVENDIVKVSLGRSALGRHEGTFKVKGRARFSAPPENSSFMGSMFGRDRDRGSKHSVPMKVVANFQRAESHDVPVVKLSPKPPQPPTGMPGSLFSSVKPTLMFVGETTAAEERLRPKPRTMAFRSPPQQVQQMAVFESAQAPMRQLHSASRSFQRSSPSYSPTSPAFDTLSPSYSPTSFAFKKLSQSSTITRPSLSLPARESRNKATWDPSTVKASSHQVTPQTSFGFGFAFGQPPPQANQAVMGVPSSSLFPQSMTFGAMAPQGLSGFGFAGRGAPPPPPPPPPVPFGQALTQQMQIPPPEPPGPPPCGQALTQEMQIPPPEPPQPLPRALRMRKSFPVESVTRSSGISSSRFESFRRRRIDAGVASQDQKLREEAMDNVLDLSNSMISETLLEVDKDREAVMDEMSRGRMQRHTLFSHRRLQSGRAQISPGTEMAIPRKTTFGIKISKWQRIFSLQQPEGYWEISLALGELLNCDISRFADDFLKRKGIVSLGVKAHTDILRMLATLLVLQLMRVEKRREGQLLRTLFCLEDNKFRPEHWEAVNKAVEWARWADRQYPCVYSRLEFGLSWDSSTKQLLGVETIHHCSPLIGLNLNPMPMIM